jgi:valyl-tRNA synthetase
VSTFALEAAGAPPAGSVVTLVDGAQVCLGLAGAIDVAAERARIEKDVAKADGERRGVKGRLDNPSFVGRAPGAVVDKERERLAELDQRIAKLTESLQRLAQLG